MVDLFPGDVGLVEQLQSFSNHNKKRQDDANEILDRMPKRP